MGTERCDYIIIGMNFTYDKLPDILGDRIDCFLDNPYDSEVIGNHNGLTLIQDGMSGEYSIFGEVITKAINDGFSLTGLSKITKNKINKVKNKIMAELKDCDDFPKMDIYILSHWH